LSVVGGWFSVDGIASSFRCAAFLAMTAICHCEEEERRRSNLYTVDGFVIPLRCIHHNDGGWLMVEGFVHFALMQNEPKDQGWDSEAKNFPCPLKLLNYAGLFDLTSLLPSFCPRSDTEVSLRGP